MLSEHNEIKLEINNKKIGKIHKYVEIKQHTAKQPMVQMNFSGTITTCFVVTKNTIR